MTRARLAGLLVALLALAGAVLYGLDNRSSPGVITSPALRPLIAQAGLDACVGGIGNAGPAAAGAPKPLPDLSLPCLDGTGKRSLRGRGGAPTLVNVYGTWCAPCQREMPVLRQFYERSKGTVRLVGIDTEDERSAALHFAIDFRQHWPVLVDDDGAVLRAYGSGAPQTLFIDAAGRVVHVERGGYTSLAVLTADVRKYLGAIV